MRERLAGELTKELSGYSTRALGQSLPNNGLQQKVTLDGCMSRKHPSFFHALEMNEQYY